MLVRCESQDLTLQSLSSLVLSFLKSSRRESISEYDISTDNLQKNNFHSTVFEIDKIAIFSIFDSTILINFLFPKEGDDMGRSMIISVLVLFLCSVVPLGCSTSSDRPISQSDIPDLIGKWEGRYNPGGWPQRVTVQILNDSLEGNISFSTLTSSSGFAAKAFTGKIENGTLVVSWEKDCWINMKFGKEKMKLEGNIQTSASSKETLTLEKIK